MPEKFIRSRPRRVRLVPALAGLAVSLTVSTAVSATGHRAGVLDLFNAGFTVAIVAAVVGAGPRAHRSPVVPAVGHVVPVAEVEPLRRAA